jgi:pentapeptide MXKDX repeat protein
LQQRSERAAADFCELCANRSSTFTSSPTTSSSSSEDEVHDQQYGRDFYVDNSPLPPPPLLVVATPVLLEDAQPKPDAMKPDAMNPAAMKPDAMKPDAMKPDVMKPDVMKPDVMKPDVMKPDVMKPDLKTPPAADVMPPTPVFPNDVRSALKLAASKLHASELLPVKGADLPPPPPHVTRLTVSSSSSGSYRLFGGSESRMGPQIVTAASAAPSAVKIKPKTILVEDALSCVLVMELVETRRLFENQIVSLRAQMADRDRDIASLHAQMSNRDLEIASLRSQNAEVAFLRAQTAELTTLCVGQKSTIESLSWPQL